MVVIDILVMFPIIISPSPESNPKIQKRNSGYMIVYEMEDNKVYGADLT
jgi:hypothetical protein